ncbi:MAG: hypothetical protein KDA60_13110, partial [Planctomycetales bacterium]|nr:hypothetical protein [Planctomycetales bacterium]
EQLVDVLEKTGRPKHLVVVDSGSSKPWDVTRIAELTELAETSPTDGAANVPALMEATLEYFKVNEVGRGDVWICSDLQRNNWQLDSATWEAIRAGFQALPIPIRVRILAYDRLVENNLAVRVSAVRRTADNEGDALAIDIDVQSAGEAAGDGVSDPIPLEIVVDGARSVLPVSVGQSGFAVRSYEIPLPPGASQGWGKVELPHDANLRDNVFYFSYGQPVRPQAVVVSDDVSAARILSLAAAPPVHDAEFKSAEAIAVSSTEFPSVNLRTTGLVLWHGPLPRAGQSIRLQRFVEAGGQVLFLPFRRAVEPAVQFAGLGWSDYEQAAETQPWRCTRWRDQDGLLRFLESGEALPMGDLQVRARWNVNGSEQVLARLDDGVPFVTRNRLGRGDVFCLATSVDRAHSNLAQQGVVLFAVVQRLLDRGMQRLASSRMTHVGDELITTSPGWQRLDLTSHDRGISPGLQAGVFRVEDLVVARNRPASEDLRERIAATELTQRLRGLDVSLTHDSVQRSSSLVNEIWRLFAGLAILALLAEAVLCLPDASRKSRSIMVGS